MSNFQVMIYENDGRQDSLDNFKKVFGPKVGEALSEKFQQAKGAYVVQGHFDSKYVSLDTRIARELWKDSNKKCSYEKNYLIVVKPDPSSNWQDSKFIVPDEELMGELIVVGSGRLTTVYSVIKGVAIDYNDFTTLEGTNGDDKHSGAQSNDVIKYNGRSGDDIIYGSNGDDMLEGGEGHDLLVGGGDADWLLGGPDNDHYVVEGRDVIVDSDGGVITFDSPSAPFSPEACVLMKDGADLIVSAKENIEHSGSNWFRVLDFFNDKGRFTFVGTNALATGKKYKFTETKDGQYKLALATK